MGARGAVVVGASMRLVAGCTMVLGGGASYVLRADTTLRRTLRELTEHSGRDDDATEDRGQQMEVSDPGERDQRSAVGDDDFNRHDRTRDRRGRG